MHKLVVILSCLAVGALANPRTQIIFEQLANGRTRCRSTVNCRNQGRDANDCPIVNCPVYERPPFSSVCSPPDCSNAQYRQFLHAAADPFTYWQCVRADALGNWVALQRHCACPTAFDYGEQRCVFVHELSNNYRCNAWNPFPSAPVCVAECPTCDDDSPINTPPPPVTPDTTVSLPEIETSTPGNGDCSVCCIPCIWWPCNPCQSTGCACNNQNNNQPQRPQPPTWPQQPIQPPTWPQQPIQPPNNQIPQWPNVPQRPNPQPIQPPSWEQPGNQIPQWPIVAPERPLPNLPQWNNQWNQPNLRPFEIDAEVAEVAAEDVVEEVEA